MRPETFEELLDACHEARQILGFLPTLPAELTRTRLQILEMVSLRASGEGAGVRVGDIADALHITRPSITREVAALERRGDLCKVESPEDGRAVLVTLTAQGRRTHRQWVEEVHAHAAELLGVAGITEEDVATCARTLARARAVMGSADLQGWQNERLGKRE